MFKVFIPSMSRAGNVKTSKIFKDHIIVCPERQKKEYKQYHKNVIGCPDNIKGITRTRNWILDYCEKNGIKYHIQIDDDVQYFYYTENSKMIKLFGNTFEEIDHIWHIFNSMFVLTEEWGLKVFGFRMIADNKAYREYSPFSTLTVIGANVIGIINNELRFDENLPIKEDYDYSIQHIKKFGGALKMNKYGVMVSHLTDEGGCSEYRSKRMEYEVLKKMQKKWGSNVVRESDNDNIMSVRIPIKGI